GWCGRGRATPIAERVAPDDFDDGEARLFDKSRAGRIVALPVERRRHAGGQPGGLDEELRLLYRARGLGQERVGDDEQALRLCAVAIDLPEAILCEAFRRLDYDALDACRFHLRPVDRFLEMREIGRASC